MAGQEEGDSPGCPEGVITITMASSVLPLIVICAADGNEGGKHNLIKATVSGGKLFILQVQIGDKRWIRGQDKEAEGVFNSFQVA